MGSTILAKLRPYPRTLKVLEHSSVEFNSEKQEIEHHEVKRQDAISGTTNFLSAQQRALDSELSLSQSSLKFPDDKYVLIILRSSTSSSITHLIQRKNVGFLVTVCRPRFISYFISRNIGNLPVKAKARLVFSNLSMS